MEEKKELSREELLAQIEILRKTIQIQHETINRLVETYVLKEKSTKDTPTNTRK